MKVKPSDGPWPTGSPEVALSAFGVVHKAYRGKGEAIHRVFMGDEKTNMIFHAAKKVRAGEVTPGRAMDQKMRMHAMEHRRYAGTAGTSYGKGVARGKLTQKELLAKPAIKRAKEEKKVAHAMYAGISRNNRKTRVLP